MFYRDDFIIFGPKDINPAFKVFKGRYIVPPIKHYEINR